MGYKHFLEFVERAGKAGQGNMFRFAFVKIMLGALIALCAAPSVTAGEAPQLSLVRKPVALICIDPQSAPRVFWGCEQLQGALGNAGYAVSCMVDANPPASPNPDIALIEIAVSPSPDALPESCRIAGETPGSLRIEGADDSGALYGCMELAWRVRQEGALPAQIDFEDAPAFRLRGACVGMQLPSKLPGRETYEYPYTLQSFPWFYDKAYWTAYLDVLAGSRMNTLYLWNGHPFASLVRLEDYPEAVEVDNKTFKRNEEMYRFLIEEADKRGVRIVQMFYNIIVSKPFAEAHGIGTQHAAPTPLTSDYMRKSIAKFVEKYPNAGLLVCLGEALKGQENKERWMNETVIPGVRDGLAKAGVTDEPPIIVRAHSVGDPAHLIASAREHYSNIDTMAKYNGESLTTWEPRGEWRGIHQSLSRLGEDHVVNVHLLSNLEPFRYGATEFIRKAALACRDRLGATGVHVYPLAYWSWPWPGDAYGGRRPVFQFRRDWVWFEAWGRYAWNPDRDSLEDHEFWKGRLTEFYGSPEAAMAILTAYNESGECAPMLLRRFGITEGNRQTFSLGMTLDELVHPDRYGAYSDLWESHSPEGERLQEFVKKEWEGKKHEGETPESVIAETLKLSGRAVAAMAQAAPSVKRNDGEFARLRNDVDCIRALTEHYAAKVRAAECVLRYDYSHDFNDMREAGEHLGESLEAYRRLEALTRDTYRFANSMQTGHRRIPVRGEREGKPAFYHWTQVLPEFEREYEEFKARVGRLEKEARGELEPLPPEALPPAPYTLLGEGDDLYRLEPGARLFPDCESEIVALAPELAGLSGVRLSAGALKAETTAPVRFTVNAPVHLLVGYFASDDPQWAKPPNPDIDSRSADHGGVEAALLNAVTAKGLPPVNVHVFRYDSETAFDPRGPGRFVILGAIPAMIEVKPRDCGLSGGEKE